MESIKSLFKHAPSDVVESAIEAASICMVSPPRQRLYLAGPMRGIPYYNYPEFERIKGLLTLMNVDVVSPVDLDRDHGFDAMKLPEGWTVDDVDWHRMPEGLEIGAVLARNVKAIGTTDGIVVMDGWRRSGGSLMEMMAVRAMRLKLYEIEEDTHSIFGIKLVRRTLVEPRLKLI